MAQPHQRVAAGARPLLAVRAGSGEPARDPDVLSWRSPSSSRSDPGLDPGSEGTRAAHLDLRHGDDRTRVGAGLPLGHRPARAARDARGMRPPTPSQTVGPFFGFALPLVDATDGMRVEGQVLDGAGEPVADALLEVWRDEHFARCRTDEEGAFHFLAPEAPLVNVTVFARGLLRHLNTRMYLPGA